QREEHAGQHDRRLARAESDRAHARSTRQLSRNDPPRNSAQVAPASGQARKIHGIGSSASSESWSQPKRTNWMPHQTNTSANASTQRLEMMRSSAVGLGPRAGQTSTSKRLCSRLPHNAAVMHL